jgi:hypothetical protein
MSSFSLTPARATGIAALALFAAAAGCNKDAITQVTDPDIFNVGDYNTPAGADPLRIGVIANFAGAFDAATDSYVNMSGNLADEMLASDTFDGRLTINARKSVEVNSEMEGVYRNMQRARAGARRAADIIAVTTPNEKVNQAELYMYLGYSELLLGEGWCSGVPFSSEDGETQTFGDPQTTDQIMTVAAGHFDQALTLVGSSTGARADLVRNGAKIGKGRALLNQGKFSEATAAVSGVPTAYLLNTGHSANSGSDGQWSGTTSGKSRYKLTSLEGGNGLPFLEQTPAQDPRIDWSPSSRVGFSGQFSKLPNTNKFTQYGDGVITTGAEARLIELEAQLQTDDQATRDAVFASLNSLRTNGAPIGGKTGSTLIKVPAMSGSAPTTKAAAIDLLYKERGYWFWLTGHRLGDLRRLVRIYGRNAETVFPTGPMATATSPIPGNYGTSTAVTIPFSERNNPKFQGCLEGA